MYWTSTLDKPWTQDHQHTKPSLKPMFQFLLKGAFVNHPDTYINLCPVGQEILWANWVITDNFLMTCFFFSRIITAETHSVYEIPYVFLCVQVPLSRKIYFCVEHWKKVIRMTALIFTGDVTGDVEDKHQGLKWIPQLSTWWPFHFCECSNSLTWLLL